MCFEQYDTMQQDDDRSLVMDLAVLPYFAKPCFGTKPVCWLTIAQQSRLRDFRIESYQRICDVLLEPGVVVLDEGYIDRQCVMIRGVGTINHAGSGI